MKVIPTGYFNRTVKRLHPNEKAILDKAIQDIMANVEIGDLKTGDLAGIRVYKFKVNQNLQLLAYSYLAETEILYLLEYGSHENFYRDLKRQHWPKNRQSNKLVFLSITYPSKKAVINRVIHSFLWIGRDAPYRDCSKRTL